MESLVLERCHLKARNGFEIQYAATDLSQHPMLRSLQVDCVNGVFLALHNGIVNHPTLQELIIDGTSNNRLEIEEQNEVTQAVSTILEPSSSAQRRLRLECFTFDADLSFAPFVHGIQTH